MYAINMNKNARVLLVLILTVLCLGVFLPSVRAESRTIVVPDDYPTITNALIYAADGDTVFVKEGTYLEHRLTLNKSITLMGENANNTEIMNIDTRIWDPSMEPFPPAYPIAIEVSANNVKVTGFTLTCKFGLWTSIGIAANNSVIAGNIIGKSSGLSVNGNNNTIAQNLFEPDVTAPFLSCIGSYNVIAGNIIIRATNEPNFNLRVDGSFNLVNNNTLNSAIIEISGNSNTIAKNKITNGEIELDRASSNNKIISNNKVERLSLMGFNNTFDANEILSIEIGGTHNGSIDAANNIFYRNNFLGNVPELRVSIKMPGYLKWDNDNEGNYWISYNRTDANGDGIGDEPYQVTAVYSYYDGSVRDDDVINCGQDNYPLMVPFDIDSVNVTLPEWALTLLNPPEPQVIGQPPATSSEPFPTTPVVAISAASVAVVVAGLLVYHKKQKRSLNAV
jgi:nitrous oxidase accessory protein